MLSSVGSTCAPSYTTAVDAELRHLGGDPLRVTGRGHARVGHHERATHGVLEQVVTDLVVAPVPNFSWGAP
jgi:hypothetical protein